MQASIKYEMRNEAYFCTDYDDDVDDDGNDKYPQRLQKTNNYLRNTEVQN
jgi:hypothetical protein